jgi:sugar lactone lactonase YvrE
MILISMMFFLSNCREAKNLPTVAFTLEEKEFIPEGITYDPVTEQFFVSSIGKERIVAISGKDKVSDFIASGQDSIMQTLGMKVDADKRRLWVVSNKRINEVTYSAVHVYNIDTHELIKKIVSKSTEIQLFNDIVLTKKGDAFITDSFNSKIYRVGSEETDFELFAGPDSLLQGVNGIAVSPDDRILYPLDK